MNNPKYQITVDGIDYQVEVKGLREDATEGSPEVVWVYDANGQKVADAEWDDACEAVIGGYFNEEEGFLGDHGAYMPDLYSKGWREVAEWLVATHPGN